MFPFGQGDLEGALLFRLRECIVDKQHAKQIADDRAQELKRLSDRSEREKHRRETILVTRRRGYQDVLRKRMTRLGEQGGKSTRTGASYEKVRRSLRFPDKNTTGPGEGALSSSSSSSSSS